jgi:hypothetical protein
MTASIRSFRAACPAFSRAALFVCGVALVGCGAELERASEVTGLRVIAVQKDKPYADPGDTIAMKMLYVDGSEEAGRPIQIGWLAGCVDPPGDLYQGCFAGAFDPTASAFDQGDDLTNFSFKIPADIITRRPPPPDPRQPPYGIAVVFFAACAGTLSFELGGAGFPIHCLDPEGKPLLSKDFVAGYSTVYSFEGDFPNQNPGVTGFSFNGQDIAEELSCVGDSCLAPGPDPEALPAELTVPACPEDGDPAACDGVPVSPLVDRMSAELDAVTASAYGRNYQEMLWISYYATGGALKSDTRLLNDATRGWNADYGTEFYAPSKPGPVRIIAAVHDNRGGVAWAGTTILVK